MSLAILWCYALLVRRQERPVILSVGMLEVVIILEALHVLQFQVSTTTSFICHCSKIYDGLTFGYTGYPCWPGPELQGG